MRRLRRKSSMEGAYVRSGMCADIPTHSPSFVVFPLVNVDKCSIFNVAGVIVVPRATPPPHPRTATPPSATPHIVLSAPRMSPRCAIWRRARRRALLFHLCEQGR